MSSMKKIGLKKRKDPKGRYAKFGEDGLQLSDGESGEDEGERSGVPRRGGKVPREDEDEDLSSVDLERGDDAHVIGVELANRLKEEGKALRDIEGDVELREIDRESTIKAHAHDDDEEDKERSSTTKDERGETTSVAPKVEELDASSVVSSTPPVKQDIPLGPNEVMLKLQITGLEREIRREARMDKNFTIKQLKETEFAKEIGEGFNIRIFHSGRMQQDHFSVEKLSGEFVHCFLSRLVKIPATSSRTSTIDEENPGVAAIGDVAHINIWPTLMGISTGQNGSRIEWMSTAPNQGVMTSELPDDFSRCAIGMHDSIVEWPTFTGLLCGFCFFPWGMIICLLHRQHRCRRCGAMS